MNGCKQREQDALREECGVFGVSLQKEGEAAGLCYNGLLALQHRGQEGAGIAAARDNALCCRKGLGLVTEALSPQVMEEFPGAAQAIGHVRYSTTGANTVGNVQPFVTEFLTGRIATAHNGNVVNAREIREKLTSFGLEFTATSDSEVVSSLIAYKVMRAKDFVTGVKEACRLLRGAFSLVVLSGDGRMVAVRDPNGFRPLCLGENGSGVAVASESCALDSCGFRFLRDVKPGEAVLLENGRILHSELCLQGPRKSMCVFEYVYFSRPDSVLDGQSVYEARLNMGRMLAREHPVEADVVCGVPDSGLEAAMGYSLESGIPTATGFVKNRYIGRSFIFPTQAQREHAVDLKLNPLRAAVAGKRVVLVDDSIVRGTTCDRIVAAVRRAGAKEVHLRISSPPFRHTCYYGTDIGSEENLIANQLSISDIEKKTGADTLGYISVEGLLEACGECGLPLCTGCFTGDYPGPVEEAPKDSLE